jgi:outer membrane immunogenic protein
MKQLIRLTILFCGCAALALTVVAGPEALPSGKEMKQVAPAPLPECNWTGFYIGINVGGQFGHSEDTDDPGDPNGTRPFWNNPDKPWGYSESGVVGGGTVGYNHQWHWIVLGIEADGGYMNVEGSGVEPDDSSHDTFGHTDSDFFTTFRGRLGIAMNTWMFYATGGGIGLNYEQRITDTNSTPPGTGVLHAGSHQEFQWGYTVGGGIEKMLGCHWSIKAEYLYFAIDRNDFTARDTSNIVYRFNGDTMGHIVRAGLNYKF